MEEPSNPMNDREFESADKDDFSLIDGSELDDLFVSMSEPRFMDNKANSVDGGVNMLEKPDAERHRKNEKYNLRKSLAWDSAFFTNAGVLDAEELSSIIDGSSVGKHEMQRLPGIQEDVSKSTDSFSTLESDNLTLETLEADLFSDIRASIQRSGNSSKLRKSNLTGRPEETKTSQLGKNITEIKHGNIVKPKSTQKKLNTNLQGDGKLMKLSPSREQVRKPVVIRRESTSSLLKSTPASGKGSSIGMVPAKVPIKRMSISAGRIISDASNVGNGTAPGRVTTVSKGDRPGDSRSIFPKAASSAKSSTGLTTTTRTGISSTRSSCDSTSSSSSVSSRILPLNGLQGKINRPGSIPPPGMKSRIPSKGQLKGKHPPNTSRISSKLSALMLSPSVSPTSSVSEWSSSSSTLNASQEHSVSKDCSSLHSRTVSLDSNASQDLQIHPNQQASCENEIEVAGVPGISAQALSAGNGSVSNAVSAKPSGLRMPSPKIGFFDGVKTGGRSQNAAGSMQSRSHLSSSRLPKSTTGSSSPGGVSNKGRIGHATVKATAFAAANANPGTRKSNARAATGGGRREGMLTAPGKDSNSIASEDVLETPSLKTSAKNNSLAVAKLPVGEKHHPDPESSSRKKSGVVSPSNNATSEGMSHCQGNLVSCVVEADHHPMEINNDSKVLNPHLLHGLLNGDTVITELHPISMSEVGNAIKGDEIADPVVVNVGHEATNEKNDSLYAVVTDRQSAVVDPISMNEEVCNAIKVDVTADPVVMNGCNGATKENSDPVCAVVLVTDQESSVLDPVSMYEEVRNAINVDENADSVTVNGGHESTNEKNDPICAVVTDQQVTFVDPVSMSEGVHNAIKVDENADPAVANGGGEATNEKNDPTCVAVADQQSAFADPVSMSEEVRNAIEVDVNADPVGLNGWHEAANEKNRPICAVVTDQETSVLDPVSMPEEVRDASKVDENADTAVVNECNEATNENNSPICAMVTDQQSTFVDPVSMSEEVCNAFKVDENADPVVANGCNEATNEKNDPICVVVTGQQTADVDTVSMSEEVCNAIKADENADPVVANGWHEATNEKKDPICVVVTDKQSGFVEQQVSGLIANVEALGNKREQCDFVSGSHSPEVLGTVELSGSNQKREAADLPKQVDLPVSAKKLESKPGSRTPFADKNSLPDAYAMDVLLKSFSSLSLDNVQSKDVETRMT